MSRGQPDYGNPNYSISQVAFDPSLFLTALKGINSIDGKGRVWKIDNFNNGFGGWQGDKSGNGNLPVLSVLFAEVDSVSAKMDCGTLAGGGETRLFQGVVVNTPVVMGFEVGCYLVTTSPDYTIFIDYASSSLSFRGGVTYSVKDGKVYIYNNGVKTAITTFDITHGVGGWLPLKIAIDFTTGRYMRVVYGSVSLDATQYVTESLALGGAGTLSIELSVTAVDNSGQDGYIGHAIITLDEP